MPEPVQDYYGYGYDQFDTPPPSEADTEGYSEFGYDDEPEPVPPPQVMAGVAAGGWAPDADRRRNWRNWAWENRQNIIGIGSTAYSVYNKNQVAGAIRTLRDGAYQLRDWYNAPPDTAAKDTYEYVPLAYEHYRFDEYRFSDPYKHAEHRWDHAISHDGKTLDARKNRREVVEQRPAEKAKEKKRDVNKGFGTGAPTSKLKDEL